MGILNMAVKIYNNLPHNIKERSDNNKKFKIYLKKFLYSKSVHYRSILIKTSYILCFKYMLLSV